MGNLKQRQQASPKPSLIISKMMMIPLYLLGKDHLKMGENDKLPGIFYAQAAQNSSYCSLSKASKQLQFLCGNEEEGVM